MSCARPRSVALRSRSHLEVKYKNEALVSYALHSFAILLWILIDLAEMLTIMSDV